MKKKIQNPLKNKKNIQEDKKTNPNTPKQNSYKVF